MGERMNMKVKVLVFLLFFFRFCVCFAEIQGTIGCTPNVRAPMVFILFSDGILGDSNP